MPAVSAKDARFVYLPLAALSEPEPDCPGVSGEERRFFKFMMGELAATELCAANLYDFEDMPWAYYADMATQMFDEARHTRINECWCERAGLGWDHVPATNIYYDLYSSLSLASRLARLCLSDELLALAGQSGRMSRFAADGEVAKARSTERVLHDEIRHVGYGLTWLKHLARKHDTDISALMSGARSELEGVFETAPGREGPRPRLSETPDPGAGEALPEFGAEDEAPGPPFPGTLMLRAGFDPEDIASFASRERRPLAETVVYIEGRPS